MKLEQMKLGSDFLPELDRKETQKAVEAALEKYRICKYLTFEEREASITPSYAAREHGETNTTSDQTAQVAISNVDGQEARRAYCERVERAVRRLPRMERQIIEERYMTNDTDYITDQHVYDFQLEPPISAPTYIKLRWRAFYKLALDLRIEVVKK